MLKRFDEAAINLERFLKLEPRNAYAHFLMALRYDGERNTSEARRFAKSGAALDPKLSALDEEPYRVTIRRLLSAKK